MVVHLGVVVLAIGFAASMSFVQRDEIRLKPGQSAKVGGHTVTYLGSRKKAFPNHTATQASIRVDNAKVYRPALSTYPFATQAIGTPSVRGGLVDDVYLTLVSAPTSRNGTAIIGVVVTPLVNWLWGGGAIIAIGTALALVPGKRRRNPTAPASEPFVVEVPEAAEAVPV
jgi:cytochrome c-type biogenesis protein CcmF